MRTCWSVNWHPEKVEDMSKRKKIILVCAAAALLALTLVVRTQMIARSPVDTDNAKNFGTLAVVTSDYQSCILLLG